MWSVLLSLKWWLVHGLIYDVSRRWNEEIFCGIKHTYVSDSQLWIKRLHSWYSQTLFVFHHSAIEQAHCSVSSLSPVLAQTLSRWWTLVVPKIVNDGRLLLRPVFVYVPLRPFVWYRIYPHVILKINHTAAIGFICIFIFNQMHAHIQMHAHNSSTVSPTMLVSLVTFLSSAC